MTPAALREAMVRAADRAASSAPPERYRWQSVWWRLHARETRNPSECLRFALNLMRLAADMTARPSHYRVKPFGMTDCEWSRSHHHHGSEERRTP